MYKLVLKSTKEQIDRIQAVSLEQAKHFFLHRKQMNESNFDEIFEVIEE
jgi:hypothetical protein